MAKRSRKKRGPAGVSGDAAARKPVWNRDWFWGLVLLAAVVLVYQPVWRAGYIWDDDTVLTGNPCIVGPLGLKEIWTTDAADICPLTLTTFWVEHALWGMAPLPYHLATVLMQSGCAVLLWRVLRSLEIPGAWVGAALWALHPVQVESVAWITEMKNTESGLFYLLTILFFIRGLKNGWDRNYGASLLFAAMAMASKSSTVMLPVVLLLCAWWVEGRWQPRHWLKVAPIFLMSLAAGVVSIWTQKLNGADNLQWTQNWSGRLVTAGHIVWFYLGKLAWPHPLILVYPRWQIEGHWYSCVPSLAVLGVLLGLWFWRNAWSRPYFFAWVYFLVALFPVLGFVNMTFQSQSFVADHFEYLAGMGPLALVGAGLARLENFPKRRWLGLGLGAGMVLILGVVSWQRASVFESEETLWTDTLAKNPDSWVGQNNIGVVLAQKGRVDEAIGYFKKSLELNPNYVIAHNDLGIVLERKGEKEEAKAEYEKAMEIDPTFGSAHDNLGHVLLAAGQLDEAVGQYRKALDLDPNDATARNDLGYILIQKGELDEAIVQLRDALRIDPNLPATHTNLGNALFKKGRMDEAASEYEKSIQLSPGDAEVHNVLGIALTQIGRMNEAIEQFSEAVQLQPGYHDAEANLARARAAAAQNGGGP